MQKRTSQNSFNHDLLKHEEIQRETEQRLEIPEAYKVQVCRYDPYNSQCSMCRELDHLQYLQCKREYYLLERIDITNSLKNEYQARGNRPA